MLFSALSSCRKFGYDKRFKSVQPHKVIYSGKIEEIDHFRDSDLWVILKLFVLLSESAPPAGVEILAGVFITSGGKKTRASASGSSP